MIRFFLSNLLIISALAVFSQAPLYFPPKTGTAWQTTSPASLNWCQPKIDSLYSFLDKTHTKGFIVLKDGKIVLEKYFGTFKQDSIWYWASAGKSMTSCLVGLAQQQNLLDIGQKTADFLGTGWTTCPPEKEKLITLRHQLSMTTGLEDGLDLPQIIDDSNCILPECLVYKSDAGTRWAYHNAAYRLLHDCIEKASGLNINQFTKAQLLDKTGMKGLWVNHIFYSTPRSMARFGLFTLAGGRWETDQIMSDPIFVDSMSVPSQGLNKSYGNLWWLNGQPTFMVPTVQFAFPGPLVPNGPPDLFMALGKNDQKVHIVPSQGLVVIRMGNDAGNVGPGGGQVPIAFDNQLWAILKDMTCASPTAELVENQRLVSIFPNPTTGEFQLDGLPNFSRLTIFDETGRLLKTIFEGEKLTVADLAGAVFFLKIETANVIFRQRLVKSN